jgi:hypothetical protein
MISTSGRRWPSMSVGVGCAWGLNARNIGNIKKSGKLLNCWITLKAGTEARSEMIAQSLIASKVLEKSSIVTQTDAAGVNCHA